MVSGVVVDASLAVPWVVAEVHSPQARALLIDWELQGVSRLVPALFASETATAILRCVRRGAVDPAVAPSFLAGLLRAVTVRSDDRLVAGRALRIAQQLGLGKAYDSLYAALAEREGCELWTGDERFYNAAHPVFTWIHWVGESR